MIARFYNLLKSDIAGGVLLGLAAILAMVFANSPLERFYGLLLSTPVVVQVGALEIAKPLLLWVNDGLMAIFFFFVGLELKRECIEGELNHWRKAVFPGIGAMGGILVPAGIYLLFNYDDVSNRNGWAIPAATDIAFALGVLSLFGSKVPVSLKVFLTSLAVFDDVAAIVIIALFYTAQISVISLVFSMGAIVVLALMNRFGVLRKAPYILVGIVVWVAVLKSGVHATLAGVVVALFIPMKSYDLYGGSTLRSLEHDLHGAVIYWILPIFAFCNAGLNFTGMGVDDLLHPVSLGIALGLFVGKQVGVFSFCVAAIHLGLAKMPKGMNYFTLYGVSVITGIGFTMSLFIGALAFEENGMERVFDERLGILLGSLVAGIAGYFILKLAFKRTAAKEAAILKQSSV